MGGLRKLIPKTFFVMLVATLAISGIPPLAGFFSKDEILGQVFSSPHGSKILWLVGLVTAGLTSFYMFRLLYMTFWGELKLGRVDIGEEAHAAHAPAQARHAVASQQHGHADDQAHGHGGVHESPWVMLAPLMVLALLSIVGGWRGIPAFMGGGNHFEQYLAPVIKTAASTSPTAMEHVSEAAGHPGEESKENPELEWALAGASVAVALLGWFFAWWLYVKRPELPDRITARIHGLYTMVLHKYYVDEGYGLLFVKPLLAISTYVFWRGVDQGVIDGTVNGAASASKGIGNELRRMQSGNIRSYAAWVAAGGAALVAYMIYRGVR